MEKKNLFRISMLLYGESEGIKKKDTVIKKVIEAAFVDCSNKPMGLSEIIDIIKDKYDITFAEVEIDNVISNQKGTGFERLYIDKEIKIRLSRQRYELLSTNSAKNIGYYIDKFVEDKELDLQVGDEIYDYLYSLFQNNITEFKSVIDGKNVSFSQVNEEISESAKIHINEFLMWDNPDKDYALVALQGYALEYSMLTCNSNVLFGTRLGTIFSNKKLYVDTNIIYYCLGINGLAHKISNENLLEKCISGGQKLYITKYTDEEFRNTLDHYISEIKKYDSASISKINYRHYMRNEDIYLFYLDWKNSRHCFKEPQYFRAFMLSMYTDWKDKYNVTVENKLPYNNKSQEVIDTIEEYSQAIPYNGKINYDAYNVFWVESVRGEQKGSVNFQSTEQFIISPHKFLKRWDAERAYQVPLIVSSSTWLILLNRFISRNRDDYACFKNFININFPQEDIITNKEFFSIVKSVEDVTDDIQQQENIIDVFVEERFSFLDKKADIDIDIQKIQEKTEAEASRILKTTIHNLEEKVECLETNLDDKDKNEERISKEKDSEILKMQSIVETQSNSINHERDKNAKLIQREIQRRMLIRRSVNVIEMALSCAIIVWQMIDLFLLKNRNNLLCRIVFALINKTPLEDSGPDVLLLVIQIIMLGGVIALIKNRIKIFSNAEYIEKHVFKIKSQIVEEIDE